MLSHCSATCCRRTLSREQLLTTLGKVFNPREEKTVIWLSGWCRKHDWFAKDCPSYLFPERATDTSIVDIDAIAEVASKFGVEEEEIHSALLSDDPHNQLAIAYHLVIDNKRIEIAKEEFKEAFQGSLGTTPPQV